MTDWDDYISLLEHHNTMSGIVVLSIHNLFPVGYLSGNS